MKSIKVVCDRCGHSVVMEWGRKWTIPNGWYQVLGPPSVRDDILKRQFRYYDACCESCRDKSKEAFEQWTSAFLERNKKGARP